MSRLDDALARARSSDSSTLPEAPPAANGDVMFPHEAEIEDRGEPSPDRSLEDTPFVEPPTDDDQVIELEDGVRTQSAEKLAFSRMQPAAVEQYRRLAARLLIAQTEHSTRVVMITSALAGEGKTLTSANLALTLSESYKKTVLLLDADLRHPSVHKVFGLPNVSGLNDGLRSDGDRKLPLIRYTDNMYILTAGRPDSDPMSVLSGDRLRRVFAEASSRFDWVIVDTPPVALLTDAHLLVSLVDAALMVIESGRTPLAAIKKAVDAIGRDRVFGVVMNKVHVAPLSYGAYDYYYNYSAQSPRI